jgi:hypothetical protein
MFSLAGINWIAVIVGVILANVLGFVWYGPLFGKPWTRAIGKSPEEMQGSPMMYAVTVIASLITMVVLAASVQAFGSATLVEGAVVGAALAIGLYATGTYVGSTFEGRNITLWQINTLYNFVVIVVMGAVFAAWR